VGTVRRILEKEAKLVGPTVSIDTGAGLRGKNLCGNIIHYCSPEVSDELDFPPKL
jgi:hypothetical protein